MESSLKTLLIVEDLPEIGKAYLRSFRRFDVEVVVVCTPQEAERFLEKGIPTCLFCDHCLGQGLPTGAELIVRWKEKYPHLGKTALVTGSDSSIMQMASRADGVFEKPPDIDAVARFFEISRRREATG
jgi:DNA-binding NtrC family response regulator